MSRRLDLHELLIETLGSTNVYFQPPESLVMNYPCIRYNLRDISSNHANDTPYMLRRCYEMTYIDEDPDNDMYEKLAGLPTCRLTRTYVWEGLHCYVYTIYY